MTSARDRIDPIARSMQSTSVPQTGRYPAVCSPAAMPPIVALTMRLS